MPGNPWGIPGAFHGEMSRASPQKLDRAMLIWPIQMQSLKIQISYQEENGLFSSLFSSLSKKERLLHCFYGEELPSPNISVIALPDTNCSFLVPSPSLGFLPNNPRPLQVLVSRLSSIQRFSPSQMLRQKLQNSSGRLHVQPL